MQSVRSVRQPTNGEIRAKKGDMRLRKKPHLKVDVCWKSPDFRHSGLLTSGLPKCNVSGYAFPRATEVLLTRKKNSCICGAIVLYSGPRWSKVG